MNKNSFTSFPTNLPSKCLSKSVASFHENNQTNFDQNLFELRKAAFCKLASWSNPAWTGSSEEDALHLTAASEWVFHHRTWMTEGTTTISQIIGGVTGVIPSSKLAKYGDYKYDLDVESMYSILDNKNSDEYGPVICSANSQQSCNAFQPPSESNTGNSKILSKNSFTSKSNVNERSEVGVHNQQTESDSIDQWLEKMNDMLCKLRSTVKQQVVLDGWTDVLLKTCLSFLSAIRTNHSLRQLMEMPMSFIIDYEQLRKEPFSKVELLSIPQPYLDEDCDPDPTQIDRLWLNLSSPNICKLWTDNDELKDPQTFSDKVCESLGSLPDSVVRTNYLRRQRQQKGHKISHENVQIPYFKAKELLGSLLNVIDGFSSRYGEGFSKNGMENSEKYFPEAHGEWTKRLFPYHTNFDQGVLSAQISPKSIEEGQERLRANGYLLPYPYPPIITEPPPIFRPIRPFQILYPPPPVPCIRHGHHQLRFQYSPFYSQGFGAAYHPSSCNGQSVPQVANCQTTQQLIIRVPPPPLPQMMPHVNCYMPVASTIKNYIPQSLMVSFFPSNITSELPTGLNIANSYHPTEHTANEFTTNKNNRILKSFQTVRQNKIYTLKNNHCCPESSKESNWENLKNTGSCNVNACSCRIESVQETCIRTPCFTNANSHVDFVTKLESCNSEAMILKPELDMQTETLQKNQTQKFHSGKVYSVITPTLMNMKLQDQSLMDDTVPRIKNSTTPNSKISKNNLAYNKRYSLPELNTSYNSSLENQNHYGHCRTTTVKSVHQRSGIKDYSSIEYNELNFREVNHHHGPNNSQYFTFPFTHEVKEELKLTTNETVTNFFVPRLTSLHSIKKLQNQSYISCEAENSFHLRLEETELLNNIDSIPALSARYDTSKDNENKVEDCFKTNDVRSRTQTEVRDALLKDKHVVRYGTPPSSINSKTFRTMLIRWTKRGFSNGKLKLLVYYISEESSYGHNNDIIAKKKINNPYLKIKSRSITLKMNRGKWVRKKLTGKKKLSYFLKSRVKNVEILPFPINISFYKRMQKTVDKTAFPLHNDRKFIKFSSQLPSTDDFKPNPKKRFRSCGNILSSDCKRSPQEMKVEIPTTKKFEVVDDSFFDCEDIQKILNENFLIKPWCLLNEKINGWIHFKIALQTVLKNCSRLLQEVSINENHKIHYKV